MSRAEGRCTTRLRGAGGSGSAWGGGDRIGNKSGWAGLRGWSRRLWGAALAVLLLLPLLGAWTPAWAQSQSEAERIQRRIQEFERRQQGLERQRQAAERRLNTLRKQANNLRQELQLLDAELTETQAELEITEARLADAERRLQQAQADLQVAEQRLAYRTDLLGRRVRAIAEHGLVGYLEVLLSASDFRDFLTRFALLRQIMEQDVELLAAVKAEREAVIERKQRIEQERQQILVLRSRLEEQKQEIEVIAAARQETYTRLQQDARELEAALDEMDRESQEIERMLQSLQQELAKLLPNDPGVFIWPVDRSGYFRISSEFGQRWHPILRTNRFHSGLDIAKPKGANVYAVAPGRVVYAGWRGGYGYTVIIAHTATRSTLYGHLSQILVSVGQDVKRGQVIAKVGSTGLSTGPHLHFEVRENGTPVNPRQFLP